jgi:hypothetical protein
MILTSPSEDGDQTPPVTTTFDPPHGRRATGPPRRMRRSRIDWNRVERLYSFVRARAVDRLHEAETCNDLAAEDNRCRDIQAIDAMFTQARQGNRVVAVCAITFFRARAMRDADHPEFLGEWLGTSSAPGHPARANVRGGAQVQARTPMCLVSR